MKVYVTVTNLLGVAEFELDTLVDPDLPWNEFIEKINLHKILDNKFPDWQGYDLNIDEEDIVIPKMFGKLELPTGEEVTEVEEDEAS